jgi:acetoin utilization deacetylase AcuC-like enzyme
LRRVAIIDFDVHHGNGTQDIFYSDPEVLYISTHQWGIFPGTGARMEIGKGDGQGTTINIPFPAGVGENGFNSAFDKIVIPALHSFKPDLLLVSAGYDAHINDPLAGLQMTDQGYYQITSKLVEASEKLCRGRLMMVLEGGYNPDALSGSIRSSCLALCQKQLLQDVDFKKALLEPDIGDLVEILCEIHHL